MFNLRTETQIKRDVNTFQIYVIGMYVSLHFHKLITNKKQIIAICLPLLDVPFSNGDVFLLPVGETPMISRDSMNL